MAMSTWFVLGVICLAYVAFGLWAVSQIFPGPSRHTPIRPRPTTGKVQDMSSNMQGHNHGGKSHLFGMLGVGALVLVVLLGTGRSFQQALPLALFLACPLMMVGMMFMMMRGGNGQQHGNDAADHRDTSDHHLPTPTPNGRTRPRPPPLSPQRPPRCPNRVIPKVRPPSPDSQVLRVRLAAGGDYLHGPGSAPLTSAFLLQQPVGEV